jgi:hypothetical protein
MDTLPEKAEKKKKGGKGRDTMFRAAYRNQANLIQIADNKANMIISVSAIIISSIIAITGYGAVSGNIQTYGPQLTVPVSLIVLSSLASVIFAVEAARPKVRIASKEGGTKEKSSLLFFGVIADHTQASYLGAMDKMLDTKGEVYEHMTIDLHNQGLILTRKYKLLGYAYQSFIVGFVLSVLVFLGFLVMG